MAKLKISDEERERRSIAAKERVAAGVMGGAKFGKLGGRPKKKRSSELVAEKAAQEAEVIWNRLSELINSENEKVSLDAIKHVQSIEETERKIEVEEEVRYEQLKHNELRELVIGNLLALIGDGRIDLGDIIEGEATLVEERPALESGEVN